MLQRNTLFTTTKSHFAKTLPKSSKCARGGGGGEARQKIQNTHDTRNKHSPFAVPLAKHAEGGIPNEERMAINAHPHTFAAGHPGTALAQGDLNVGFNAGNRC